MGILCTDSFKAARESTGRASHSPSWGCKDEGIGSLTLLVAED